MSNQQDDSDGRTLLEWLALALMLAVVLGVSIEIAKTVCRKLSEKQAREE